MSQFLLQATVLRLVNNNQPVSVERLSSPGVIVRVKPDSKFYDGSPKDSGTVLGLDQKVPGWVIVSFGPVNGRTTEVRQRYRIGTPEVDNGTCDLELDRSETVSSAVISLANQLVEVPLFGTTVSPGDTLRLEKETFKVVGVEPAIPSGALAFVSQIINGDYVAVAVQGGTRTVSAGKYAGQLELNGKVVLDQSLSVVIQNLGLEDDSFAVGQTENLVVWDDIFGQDEAKRQLREAVEGLTKHPAHYARYRKKPVKGILLSGPPGCSKTMFGKAVYSSIVESCRARGINPAQGFILVRGPEFLDKFVGVGEAMVRHVFARARKFKAKYGVPAVIFIDECEAVMAKRESGISSDVLRTLVPAILAEMDGVIESGALVIAATNKPELLDFAVTRPGRFDKSISIGRPDKKAVEQIFLRNMRGVPVEGTTMEELARLAGEKLFSPEMVIYKIRRQLASEVTLFTLADIVSGAMIPSLVDEAKEAALTRDLVNEVPSGGVTIADVTNAVASVYRQNLTFDHSEALRDFTMNFVDQIVDVEKQRQASA